MTTERRGPGGDGAEGGDDNGPDPQAGADPTDTEKRDPVDPEESIDTEQRPDIA